MASTATTRKVREPRATTRRPKNQTAPTPGPQVFMAPEPVTEGVDDAPEVPHGAVRLGQTSATPIEREVLFYVGEVGYTIPKTFSPAAALGYAHVQRTHGASAAVDWAFERALGPVGYAVLREQDDVTFEQLDNMAKLIIARIEGLPDPKPSGS